MEKYRRVEKSQDAASRDENEIRVSAMGVVSAYVTVALAMLGEQDKKQVVIAGSASTITKAVTLAEVIKRRVKGLHQTSELSSLDVVRRTCRCSRLTAPSTIITITKKQKAKMCVNAV